MIPLHTRNVSIVAIFLYICLCSCSQSTLPQKQTLKSAPNQHRSILENDHTRVMEVILPPGEKVPLHNHDLPAVIIIHQTSRAIVRNSNGEIVSDATPPIGAYWTIANRPLYSIENAGKQTMHLYRVEIK